MPVTPRLCHFDVLILGGGIAGLWSLARLLSAGVNAALIEHQALGTGQTIASQGIIHGGVKYSLAGAVSEDARAIAEMPGAWSGALRGEGPVDLRRARILAGQQILWTAPGLAAKLVGVAASKAIRTRVERVAGGSRPAPFDSAPARTDVYAVAEQVLEPRGLISALADLAGPSRLMHAEVRSAERVAVADGANEIRIGLGDASHQPGAGTEQEHMPGVSLAPRAEPCEVLSTRAVVLAAGSGNEKLLRLLQPVIEDPSSHDSGHADLSSRQPRALPTMQRRPLHMVILRGPPGRLPAIYGHCLGASDKPRLTISSGHDAHGRPIWYLGGALAEVGVERTPMAQIHAARAELTECLPWLDLGPAPGLEWTTLRVDRAEGLTPGSARPSGPIVHPLGPVLVLWPTKLAFAPLVGERVMDWARERLSTSGAARAARTSLAPAPSSYVFPTPPIAPLPWDDPRARWHTLEPKLQVNLSPPHTRA